MKKYWQEYKVILFLFVGWKFILGYIERISPFIWQLKEGYLGNSHWANFDGQHYISIALNGYYNFQQAFFPLYPLTIRYLAKLMPSDPELIGLIISNVAFFFGLCIFYELYRKIYHNESVWPVIFLLVFPTSFFYSTVYSGSLYFLLANGTIYYLTKHKFIQAGLIGIFASATRLFGFFLIFIAVFELVKKKSIKFIDMLGILLIPMGLIFYMLYLNSSVGDPLAFFHAQPAFGAGRSGSEIIFLPQVIWRYYKMFSTVNISLFEYKIVLFEFVSLLLAGILLLKATKQRLDRSYLIYCGSVLIVPTFTGTLSSYPRYILAAFPLFWVLGQIKSIKVKYMLFLFFLAGLIYFCSAFLQGYFVA